MMQSSKVIFLNEKRAVPFKYSNTKQHALLCKKFSIVKNYLFAVVQSTAVNMLWFKFILGLMFFELVSILFAIVPDYY